MNYVSLEPMPDQYGVNPVLPTLLASMRNGSRERPSKRDVASAPDDAGKMPSLRH